MTGTEPLPLCNGCGNAVISATTAFPLVNDVRRVVERMHPCECITVDAPLAPADTGTIRPGEDINALADAWHRIIAAAESREQDPADLVNDVFTVAGIPFPTAAGTERVAAIRQHAESRIG